MRCCAMLVLMGWAAVACGQDAVRPVRRTIEYPWMSVARWNELHDACLKRAQEGPIDVLFLGDSITQGWSGAGKMEWEKRFVPMRAANFGIGGDMTQQVLWRITEGKALDGVSPKAVVLMIGTNNFGLGKQAPEDVVKGVSAIVETLQRKLPDAKILLLGIFPRDAKPGTPFRKQIAAVNEQIAKLDDGGKRVRYLDLGPKFLDAEGNLAKEIMPDALHLSGRGYTIWADQIATPLAELLKSPAPAR